mmetsp:Transcript_37679/g.70463  ORF Transcript_37679/g.70463 Transcript_37679/m.70463 type:complete len:514 (+) Transcript_37679:57-1598(+)
MTVGSPLGAKLLDDDTPQPKKTPCNTYVIVFVASLGGFLFGYDTGIVSGAMLEIKHPGSGIASDTEELTNVAQEVIVSSTIGAAAVGSMMSGVLQRFTYFGRRTCALLGSILFAIGAIVMALASSVPLMVVGRVIVGVAVGIASQVVPTFIAEVAPPHLRGSLVILNNAVLVLGQVSASGVACAYAAIDQTKGTVEGWRWMLGWGAFPAFLMFFGLFVLPESPRWLLSVPNDAARALKALRWLRQDEELAQAELTKITSSIVEDREQEERSGSGKSSLLQKLMTRRVRSALALGVGLQLLQQCAGINTIMYYSGTIIQMASKSNRLEESEPKASGLSKSDVHDVCMTIPVAACQLLGNFVGMALADRKGRRPLALTSLMCCAVSLLALGFAFYPEKAVGWLSLMGMCFYLFTFGIGMAPVPWLVNAEIYPLEVRSVANSLATAANWVANYIVAQTFLDIAEALSTNQEEPSTHPDGAFWLYGAVAIIGFFSLFWKMPETANKTLEEMDEVFGG